MMENNDSLIKYEIKNIKQNGSDVVDFAFYSFSHFLQDAGHLSESHRHNFYSFIISLEGSGSHIIDFEEYEIKANRLFFINYDQIHSWKITSDVKGYIILFSKTFYNLIFTGNDLVKSDTAVENLPVFVDIPADGLKFWLNNCDNIQLEFQKPGEFSKEIICLLLKTCVLKMDELAEDSKCENIKPDHKSALVSDFKKMVYKNFKEKKTTKDYAEELSITPNYLNSVVKAYLGKSAGTVIKNRVILEARRLLSHTDLSVRQISLELGFTDNSHFGKYFKNSTGDTPETFRKKFINT